MISSFVRIVAVIGLAVTCGAAQAGLVVFDSTDNLAATRLVNPSSNQNLRQNTGVTFTVGSTAILLQDVTFGIYRETEAATNSYTASLYAGSQTNTPVAGRQITQSFLVNTLALPPNGTAAVFSLGSGWLLNANTQYTLAISRAGTAPVTSSIASTGVPRNQFTQSGVTLDHFIWQNSAQPITTNYWIQFNAFDDPAVVPEPATIGLLAGGLGIGLGQRIRRRRRKASTDGGSAKSATAFGKPLHRLKAVFSR